MNLQRMILVPMVLSQVFSLANCHHVGQAEILKDEKDREIPLTIPSWGNGAPELLMRVPKGWKLEHRKNIDFDLNYITDPKKSGCLFIYIGHHPQMDVSPPISKLKCQVGPKEIEFLVSKEEAVLKMRAIVDGFFPSQAKGGVGQLKLHIVISGSDPGFTKDACRALSTLESRPCS